MKGCQVLVHVEVLLLVGTALGALGSQVERAQSGDLHLLRVKEHLDETGLELLEHALHHVLGKDRSVLGDVLGQLGQAQCFDTFQSGVPLPEHHRLTVLDVILVNFIKNFTHDKRLLKLYLIQVRTFLPF